MKMKYKTDESNAVEYNGEKYYLRIRGQNEKNPVVLFLHGGCGSPDRAHIMKYQSPLADRFTLVCWDQRGSGLAYDKDDAKKVVLTKELYINDAYNVVCYLKNRFGKEKIIIVGHSFGSVLGVWLTKSYPSDIAAYIGVGQAVDYDENEILSYRFTLAEAKRRGDVKASEKLAEIGEPAGGKYKGNHFKSQSIQRSCLHRYGGAKYGNTKPYFFELLTEDAPIILREYSLYGAVKYIKGINYCLNSPIAEENPDFLNNTRELKVPVYLLLGRHDYNCCSELSEKWLNSLTAPDKKLIWFENSAHFPQWEEPEKWNDAFASLFT